MGDPAKPAGEARRAPETALVRQIITDSARPGLGLQQWLGEAIARIDARLSAQLAEIMHAPRFLQLEGSWRGLHHLVTGSGSTSRVKIRVLNITKRQLFDDLARDVEYDQRRLFRWVYVDEFAIPEGELYGVLPSW